MIVEWYIGIICFNVVLVLAVYKQQLDIKWNQSKSRQSSFLPEWCTLCFIFWVSVLETILYAVVNQYLDVSVIFMPFIITVITLNLMKHLD